MALPKDLTLQIMISAKDRQILQELSNELEISMAEAVRRAVREMHRKVVREK